MKLHEFQAKQLFAAAGIPVPRGLVASTPDDARRAFGELAHRCGDPRAFACAVKAQVHAGGRGKAGGIRVAASADEAAEAARALLGQRLVTPQTGPEGLQVGMVWLEERLAAAHEYYLAATIDRFRAQPVLLASRRGGMDIEAVAAQEPAAILRLAFDVDAGPDDAALARLAGQLGLTGAPAEAFPGLARTLWNLYESRDASLIEINPLAATAEGRLAALDAKVLIDDNALFRQPELAAWRDPSQEHPIEFAASQAGISYVGLDGTIGCLVNGAGLAMATNDIITLVGGRPANFLDVGGGANVEQVTKAFGIILSDARVRAVLVNIFGGIMRCDWVAQGLLNATRQLNNVHLPIVVRLQGTNVEEGRRLLAGAKRLNLISADELEAAARTTVELAASR